MTRENFSLTANLRYDIPSAIVVFLVALPLCLGIALASGAPLFSGLIAGIVGGVVIGALSKSSLSVSGPAAGLTVIVLAAIQDLGSFEAFLLAGFIAGLMQIGFGVVRAGVIGDFIPSTVIKGMLAAIGLILILKQLPHAIGYDSSFEGSESFADTAGENTFSALTAMLNQITPGAALISFVSLAFLFWWDKKQPKQTNFLRYLPGPLIVVAFGIAASALFAAYFPNLTIAPEHFVTVPVANSAGEFFSFFRTPDFTQISNPAIWTAAITLALVASIETLLSIEAIDKLDPYKRITPTNRELFAQGVGNSLSAAIGGLPITAVIVRGSANVNAGARTKLSAILHGLMLLASVIFIPQALNQIPLAALAAILIMLGYKLVKPKLFKEEYAKGWMHLIPFVVTIAAILLTDLLMGIGIGVVVGAGFVMLENFRSAILLLSDGNNHLIRCMKDLFFIHKYELKKKLNSIPEGASVLVDLTRVRFMDLDNVEILKDFMESAQYKDITVTIKNGSDNKINGLLGVMHEAA